ncbi:protein FAM210B, mitochondrial [Osmerus eperlanus]|uniref:protein FAM210B, mitochondrial n=1 Tax=Osmerus eperlanus TaxID=29151 RepID=UPI002E12B727
MFLGRKVRLSTAAVGEAWNSIYAQVTLNRLGDVTCSTLRYRHTFQCPGAFSRSVCCPDLELSPCEKRRGEMFTAKNYLDSSHLIISQWEHLARVTPIAPSLSRSQNKSNVLHDSNTCKSLSTLILVNANGRSKLGTVHSVLFTNDTTFCSTRFLSTIVQMRASSTATKEKREAGTSEDAVTDNKENPSQSSSSPGPDPGPGPGEDKPSRTQQLKKVFKEYGAVGVSFHVCISLMSLGMFYLAVSSGIDMAGLLCKLGFSESGVQSKMAAGTSTLVLAYAVHKLFAPVRISITLVSVPLIVRHFRKTGLFRPPGSAP